MPGDGVYLVAGLGNPGSDYAKTRHNAGFLAVDALAAAFDIAVQRKKFDTLYGRGRIKGVDLLLAKPQAYMNRSGPPLQRLAHYFGIQRKAMVIVHDDIDLAFKRLKIKEKGGDGGHKGIRSIIGAFGEDDFTRVRLGVGRSERGGDVVGHVLSSFSREEQTQLDDFLQDACDAIVTILIEGTKKAMNQYNQKSS
jgi:PTH1 family peptidyl-tRNA hydrolase